MIHDIVVYFQISSMLLSIFLKKYVQFLFSFEDNLAQHVASLAQQSCHTQSTQPCSQVSWWSHCWLVFKNPHQLKLFLMMSLCIRAGVQKKGVPLTFGTQKHTTGYFLANALGDKYEVHLNNSIKVLFNFKFRMIFPILLSFLSEAEFFPVSINNVSYTQESNMQESAVETLSIDSTNISFHCVCFITDLFICPSIRMEFLSIMKY